MARDLVLIAEFPERVLDARKRMHIRNAGPCPVEPLDSRLDSLAVALDDAPRKLVGRSHANLLSDYGTAGYLERIETTGHPDSIDVHTANCFVERRERLRNRHGVAIRVEHAPHAGDYLGNRGNELIGHRDDELVASGIVLDTYPPTCDVSVTVLKPDSTGIRHVIDQLDMSERAIPEEREQLREPIWWPIAQVRHKTRHRRHLRCDRHR